MTPYEQGEMEAKAGQPCRYGRPMPAVPWEHRLYYRGYHDTLDRAAAQQPAAEPAQSASAS